LRIILTSLKHLVTENALTYSELSDDDLMLLYEAGDKRAERELEARTSPKKILTSKRKRLYKEAHDLERKTGLSSDVIKTIKKTLFGKDSMSFMTDNEIEQYMKDLLVVAATLQDPMTTVNFLKNNMTLTNTTINQFMKAAGNNQEVVATILNSRKMLGGYSDDVIIKNRQIKRDLQWAYDTCI